MIKHNVIWCFFTIFCLLLSVSMSMSAAEQKIIVDPPTFTVDLIGGCNTTRNIAVKWTGSDTIQCFISTNITSNCPRNDSEGINVTYSENSPFDLPSNVDYTVEMTIYAAINIMPGVYTITTNFSCKAEEPPSPPPRRPYHPRVNIPPTADASAGETYQGSVGKEITFNGSNSSDLDGTITEWFWEFGDGTNGTGEITTHNYSTPGTYNVTLTVTDNKGDTGTYETTVTVDQPNRPPAGLIMIGTVIGNKTVEYNYAVVSTDLDNDTIRYIFDWGDGTNTTSDFLTSNTAYTTTHNWTDDGEYIVAVYAEDINGGVSNISRMTISIASESPLEEEDMTPWYILIALILAIVISIIVFAYFLHDVKKQKKK